MMTVYLAFRNLFRNVRRTVAVLLTIAIGCGTLFSFEGFINGVLDDYKDSTIHSRYGHGQINTKGYRETVYQEPWKYWINNPKELISFLEVQDGIDFIFPRVGFSALLKNGNITISGLGAGIDAEKEAKFFHSLNIVEGHPLTHEERGCLLGKGLAKALKLSPGDTVTLLVNSIDGMRNQADFRVVGIFETGSFDFDSKIFRIQLKAAQNLMKTSSIESISLGLSDEKKWKAIVEALEKHFPSLEATSFDVLDKIYYQHSVDWLNGQFKVIQIIILSIVLLGIFNTVSMAILERKQEIGNLRANGESMKSIMTLFLSEGTFLGIFGAIFGLSFSYLFLTNFLDHGILMPPGPGLTRQFYITFKFEWNMVPPALLLSVISAGAACLFAGLKVARMPIAKALRAT